MRKLIESTLVSLDGVIEAPERWASFDAESTAYSIEQLGNYDAFVMGRVTYEKLFANWGHTAGNPYLDLINAMPKYVASRSLIETAWNATLLGPDPSSAIARLKDQPGKDLIKYGTSRFDDTLVRPPDRRVPLLDHARRGRRRAAAVRGRGHLRAPPQAHRRKAGERVGDPHLRARLTQPAAGGAGTWCTSRVPRTGGQRRSGFIGESPARPVAQPATTFTREDQRHPSPLSQQGRRQPPRPAARSKK